MILVVLLTTLLVNYSLGGSVETNDNVQQGIIIIIVDL